MILAVEHGHAHVFDHAACERAAFHGLVDALFDRGDEVLRDGTADDGVDEFIAALEGFHAEVHFGELAVAAGLLFVAVGGFAAALNGLAVGDLRELEADVDLGGGLEVLDGDVDVLFAHALQQGFVRLVVTLDVEGRVALGEALEALDDLVFVAALRGVERIGDDGLRIDLTRHGVVVLGGAEGVAGGGSFELGDADDAAGADFFDRDLGLALEQDELADAFLGALVQVQHIGVAPDLAGEDAEIRHLADEGVEGALEDVGGRGAVFGRDDLGAVFGLADAFERVRHEGDDAVHEFGDADVLRGGTGEHGDEAAGEDGLVEALRDLFAGELFTLEITLHERFVGFGGGVLQLGAVFLHGVLQVGRDFAVGRVEHADDLGEVAFLADGESHRHADGLAVGFLEMLEDGVEAGALAVEAVHEHHARKQEVAGERPGAGGTDLDAVDAIEDDHGEPAGTERGDDFADELAVAGSVGQEELVVLPVAVHERSVDAGTLVLLVGSEVGDAGLRVDGPEAVNGSRLEKHQVAKGGLAAAVVACYNEVADLRGVGDLHMVVCSLYEFELFRSSTATGRKTVHRPAKHRTESRTGMRRRRCFLLSFSNNSTHFRFCQILFEIKLDFSCTERGSD